MLYASLMVVYFEKTPIKLRELDVRCVALAKLSPVISSFLLIELCEV